MSVKTALAVFIAVVLVLITIDHLGSPSTPHGVGMPNEIGNSCAPCGAPCSKLQNNIYQQKDKLK